jgi:hypothetical protein
MRRKWICRTGDDGKTDFIEISDDVGNSLPASSSSVAIHTDTIAPTWHPADGKIYDSKSQFRKVTRAHGCREVGSDWRHSDGSINRWAVASKPKQESVKETLIKVLKGEVH